MEYWNTLITEKSWSLLKELNKKIKFILIGGWAVYLWTMAHKSKDIDIIVDFEELEKIRLNYQLKKNDNLKKYEITINEIDIDIYVPFYSKLALPVDQIRKSLTKIENFNVVKPEILLILKQGAEFERGESEKGLKDRIDIMDLLLNCDVDFNLYRKKLEEHKLLNYKKRLVNITESFKEIGYLNLNPRQFKLKKLDVLKKLKP